MTDVHQIISELELKKTAIDRAIAALREIDMKDGSAAAAPSKKVRPEISRSGRERLAEAMRQRWAAKRAAQQAPASKKNNPRKNRKAANRRLQKKNSGSKNAAGQS